MLLIAVLLFSLGGCVTPSRNASPEGTMISEVAIRYVGAKTFEEYRLRNFIRTTAGSPYRSDRIDDDIKALYESGLVTDVRVIANPKRDGVAVTFEVTTRPRFGPTLCIGNTVFSDRRLAKASELLVGQKADRPVILTAARKVEAFYHANGYPNAHVSVRFDADFGTNPDAFFCFIVEEGQAGR